jgi:Dolichyl-phosphate-mannose-protein mannosyltransferase
VNPPFGSASQKHPRVVPDGEKLSIEFRIREDGGGSAQAIGESSGPSDSARAGLIRWAVLAAVMVLAGVYVGLHLNKGWVPADDGILSQSALRAFHGQLPHRDFTEIYTGGLSLLHSVAFRVFGVNLMSLRHCVFLFFLAWLPAVYYIALRFTSVPAAGLITLLAVSWSYPNYPAAMPSWYNLFFATFGAAALLRYLEVRKWRWLFVAGLCGGISVLIKVIGAYYIAAVLLFLAFVEQGDEDASANGEAPAAATGYRIFSESAVLLFLATVVFVFRKRLGIGELYDFVLPASALVLLILWHERFTQRGSAIARFQRLLQLTVPFVVGVLAPVFVFLAPYARSGALRTFFAGVMASVAERSAGLGVIRPLGVEKVIYACPLVALVGAAMYLRELQGRIVAACIAAGLGIMLYKSNQLVVSGVWFSAALLTPLVVLSGVTVVLGSARSGRLTTLQQQRIVLLISLAGLCSFAQYPFAAPIYLLYSLPLTLLAAAAIVATARKRPGTLVLASVLGFYMCFGFITLVPDYIYELTHRVGPVQELRLERSGGLRIEFAPEVEDLIHFMQQHSPNGLMYAGNDCPEFYFLAGLKNVTRDDSGAPAEQVLQALRSSDLKVVVINDAPFFPGAVMPPQVRAEAMKRFPHSSRFGIFEVLWKQ